MSTNNNKNSGEEINLTKEYKHKMYNYFIPPLFKKYYNLEYKLNNQKDKVENKIEEYNKKINYKENENERRLMISLLSCLTFIITFRQTKKIMFKSPFAIRNTAAVYFSLSYLFYKPNINPF